MPKKVMVLGAGIGQLRIIEICRGIGCELVILSRETEQPGVKYADIFYQQDISDKEVILEIARAEKIDAILTDQVDAGVLTVAYVAEKLNLPGIGYNIAQIFVNKLAMKQKAKSMGISVADFYPVSNIEEAIEASQKLHYPLVIKPADSTASKGVLIINNEADLKEQFDNSIGYSSEHMLLMEEYIEGVIEYGVESFCRDYKNINLLIGRRDYWNIPNIFVPSATVYIDADSAKSAVEQRVLELHSRVVRGFGLKFGLAHGEYLHDEVTDKIYLGEVAARGGAVFISSDIIPLACGVDANKLLVDCVLGMNTFNEPITLRTGAAGYFCYILPTGKVINIKNADKLEHIPGVYSFLNNVSVGMDIPRIKDKTSRKGPILVYGKNETECYKVMEKVRQVLQIDVETDTGEIRGINW